MPAQEIPPLQWPMFLGDFVYRHFAWNVTLEQKRAGHGKLVAANHSFLQELASVQDNGHQQITIVLGAPFEPHQTHVLDNPQRVRFVPAKDAVEIDTCDGGTVIVCVRRSKSACSAQAA